MYICICVYIYIHTNSRVSLTSDPSYFERRAQRGSDLKHRLGLCEREPGVSAHLLLTLEAY